MKRILAAAVTLVIAAMAMMAVMAVPATIAAATPEAPQLPLFFMEQDQREVHVWEGWTYSRFTTDRPMFYMGLANERLVSLQLLELAGIRVFRLPSNDPLSMILLFVGAHPDNWVWTHIRNGAVLQVRSRHGLNMMTKENNWTVWYQDIVAPDGAISVGLFQFLLSQLGLGEATLLPTISPTGEVIEESALMFWLWSPRILP